MRKYPDFNCKYEKADFEKLKSSEWQLDLLKLNPSYVYWGCFEDYMSDKSSSWASRVITPTWKEHKDSWSLDEYNELVNFYFEIYRKNHQCEHCNGTSLNPATKRIYDDWYSFDREDWVYPNGRDNKRWNRYAWSNTITDIEVEALVKGGRLNEFFKDSYRYEEETNTWSYLQKNEDRSLNEWIECDAPTMPSADAVNEWNRGQGMGHDAINQWICVETRAKNLGVYGTCEHCVEGHIYDEPEAKVALQLWYLHPRKGCSRGVYIENINQEDLPSIYEYLKEARDRNADRFSKIQ